MRFPFSPRLLRPAILVTCVLVSACSNGTVQGSPATLNPLTITEWPVPWEDTRPRDPFVDERGRVWFVGQRGDYVAVLVPDTGKLSRFDLDPGTGPHNLIVDDRGWIWYAGNRAAHIGRLDPENGRIEKYGMPDQHAGDPHTLVFGRSDDIWFTVQHGNFVGHLDMETGQVQLMQLPTPGARPYGIAVTATGVPWFTEFGVNKLGMIEPATLSVRELSLPRREARPRRLAITSDDFVWYVDYAEGYVGRVVPATGEVTEWSAPGGTGAAPYAMAVDDRDRLWFVETGASPNRLVGFDTRRQEVISITPIPSGGGTVRHMVYHPPTQTLWFGTDANTIGRAELS